MYIYVSDVYKSNNLFLPWWQGGGGVGGGGGLDTAQKWWRHLWTAPNPEPQPTF